MTEEAATTKARARWQQALDLFEQSFLLATTEREQFLTNAGAHDPALRQTLSEMWAAHREAEASNFLESPSWVYQPIEANPQALVGRRIGAYRLTQYLAKGGMGIVYLGERADKFFRRQVAIKFINTDTGLSLYHRFRREVQILADLKHPNLVLLYDAGRLGDGRPYLVMEYVAGENLRDWLRQRGSIAPAAVVEIIKQASAGLHAAHEAGVIHRDIKPANIAVAELDGKLVVKVLDFGVAARKHHDGSGVSSTHGTLGTLLYMSPEQLQSIKGADLTPAADVYALGLTAYELLTGRPANDGQSQAEVITKHLYETPPPPSQATGNRLAASFDEAVMKALAKPPHARFQTAPEFAAALELALRATATWNQNTEQLPLPTTQATPIHKPPPPTPAQRSYARPAWAAIAVLAISAGAYVWGTQWRNQTPAAPPSSSLTNQSPAPTVAPKKLQVRAEVIDVYGKPLADSFIAIFNAGITQPAQVTANNAVTLRTNARGAALTSATEVPEGIHLIKVVRAGYKTRYESPNLVEDRTRPGTVSLKITLEPE